MIYSNFHQIKLFFDTFGKKYQNILEIVQLTCIYLFNFLTLYSTISPVIEENFDITYPKFIQALFKSSFYLLLEGGTILFIFYFFLSTFVFNKNTFKLGIRVRFHALYLLNLEFFYSLYLLWLNYFVFELKIFSRYQYVYLYNSAAIFIIGLYLYSYIMALLNKMPWSFPGINTIIESTALIFGFKKIR